MTSNWRIHASAQHRACVRAGTMIPHASQHLSALQRGEDTTSCGLRVAHSLVAEKIVIKQ